ncbi:uncharacterized protein SETTUDRAFT_37897 [Exserohilum turcica Et28A]|uniref:Uncharacterized protein n=1 Tax=Exserohilum turcicum (strain 28A) TaxID=671987 RepID=R0KN85_EXST2|nr:uncharacterized protein SETTUDRAFT_37897 [Exserohilum turcica Et28A]EOA89382.1 hypothetical protein SETTUDRAFT_37897 [Exserohilum turcica Et28A]
MPALPLCVLACLLACPSACLPALHSRKRAAMQTGRHLDSPTLTHLPTHTHNFARICIRACLTYSPTHPLTLLPSVCWCPLSLLPWPARPPGPRRALGLARLPAHTRLHGCKP